MRKGKMKRTGLAVILLTALSLLVGCTGGRTVFAYTIATGGDLRRGKALIEGYSCGSCHSIPGIRNADGLVGPPLLLFGRRTYIAGEVPNTPGNLVAWLRNPKAIEPGTAMPNLGLTEQQARDIASYLYTLRSRDWDGGTE
jgi:cytochrome c